MSKKIVIYIKSNKLRKEDSRVKKSLKELSRAWQSYVDQGKLESNLNESIQKSWQRCMKYEIDPLQEAKIHVLPEHKLQQKLDRYGKIIKVATPIMKDLYQSIKGSDFIVMLTDVEGYILKSIGDDGFISQAQQVHLIEGASWHERMKGTNAIGTVIEEENPLNVYANEHFFKENHFLTCSAAPIFNADDELIGVINVSGNYQQAHQHTLGMVVAAANAIRHQLLLKDTQKKLTISEKRQQLILSSASDAFFIVDNNGEIIQINHKGSQLLGYSQQECLGKKVDTFFSAASFSSLLELTTKRQKNQEEILWNLKQERLQVASQIRRIFNEMGEITGLVVKIDNLSSQNNDEQIKRRLDRIQQIFSDLIIDAKDSQKIINILREFINTDVAFYNIYFDNLYIKAKSDKFKNNLNEFTTEEILNQYQYSSIEVDDEVYGYLIYCDEQKRDKMNEDDKMALEYAKHSLKLNLQKEIFEHRTKAKYKEQFVQDLIFDNISSLEETEAKIDSLYGWKISQKIVTIIINIGNLKEQYSSQEHNFKQSLENIKHQISLTSKEMIENVFSHIMHTSFNDSIVFIIEFGYERQKFEEKIENILEKIKRNIQHNYQFSSIIGVSNYKSSLLEVNVGYQEAKTAVKFNRRWYKEDKIMFYNELGVYKALDYIAETDIAKDLYQLYLGDLIAYDEKNNTELLHTLQGLVENNWNMKQAAEKLFIHYNTMKYRVKKIEEILDVDLNDSDQKFNLNLTLKLLQINE